VTIDNPTDIIYETFAGTDLITNTGAGQTPITTGNITIVVLHNIQSNSANSTAEQPFSTPSAEGTAKIFIKPNYDIFFFRNSRGCCYSK
jgi:hypothetical protein